MHNSFNNQAVHELIDSNQTHTKQVVFFIHSQAAVLALFVLKSKNHMG